MTATERLLVDQLRDNLEISREEQEKIELEVMEEAFEDGPVSNDERELLEALRKKLGLSSHDVREIEAELVKPSA